MVDLETLELNYFVNMDNVPYELKDGGLIYNPKALATNHFWNSWSINTASLFKNAVLFKFEEKPVSPGV